MPADVQSAGKWIAPAIFDSTGVDGMGFQRIRNRDPDCPRDRELGLRIRSESNEMDVRQALIVEFPADPWKIEMSPVGNQNQIWFWKSSVLQESSDHQSMLSELEHSELRIWRFGVLESRQWNQVADRRRREDLKSEFWNPHRNVEILLDRDRKGILALVLGQQKLQH